MLCKSKYNAKPSAQVKKFFKKTSNALLSENTFFSFEGSIKTLLGKHSWKNLSPAAVATRNLKVF